ncbi:hypothetical protein PAXRUDRAFT_55021, partial [Paxillus rubicundulus Ve08.2h10]
PPSLVDFMNVILTGRDTHLLWQLSFDGYLSTPIPITNRIRQGDPLSMILYII